MDLFFFLKLLIVLFFLVMFLRRTNVVWGIGLLTVTSAFLLDTFLGVFDRDAIEAELGFFYHMLSGAIFAGAALWLWGLLRPLFRAELAAPLPAFRPAAEPPPPASNHDAGVDRQMLYEQIQTRLSPGDVRDLIFDLELNENDVLAPGEPMTATVTRLMERAEREGKMGALALAVERVLTPIPPENLPRREKLGVDSPPPSSATIFSPTTARTRSPAWPRRWTSTGSGWTTATRERSSANSFSTSAAATAWTS